MLKVLLVEDDPDQRDVYQRVPYYNGFDVIATATAGSALDIARLTTVSAIRMMMRPMGRRVSAPSDSGHPCEAGRPDELHHCGF